VLTLPEDWRISTIGELCDSTKGSVQTGPFGSDLHASDYSPSGIPVIMPANLGKNAIIEDGIARVNGDHVARLRSHKVQKGDIVFPRRGDIARYAVVDEHQVGWLCGTGCLRIRFGENEVIEPRYLGYWLGTSIVENWLLGNAVGTTMPNLNTSILRALPVPLPTLPEQRAIAAILAGFDDKIEANRRANATLEATARALFQSWFVDFDPVRAKAEGRNRVVAWSSLPEAQAEAATVGGSGEIELLEAGAIEVSVGGVSAAVRSRAFPELGDVVGGSFYAGEAAIGRPAMLVSATIGSGPAMWYFGQEVGEPHSRVVVGSWRPPGAQ